MTSHVLLFLLLLLGAQLQAQLEVPESSDNVPTHFGNCLTDLGSGQCVYRSKCVFPEYLNKLDVESNRQCYSLQRPGLVCCPTEQNVLPLLSVRVLPGVQTGKQETTELPRYPHCGASFAYRVIGGKNTELFEFPWTALLEYTVRENGNKQHICGASFIASRWLLTAAHCVHSHFVGNYRTLTGARLGEWNKTSNPDCIIQLNGKQECAPPHVQVSIDLKIMHPQFDSENLTHDIALLRLAQPIDWHQHQHVEPVCLPPARGSRANQLVSSAADVSGWGATEHNNQPSDVKRKAVLYVQPQEQCEASFRQLGYTINNGQLCASGGVNVDSCLGDSGGPLTVEAYTPQKDHYVYQAGIVSYGKEICGETDFPGVYTRVSTYMDWIEQTINNNSKTPGNIS
ncbi:serine protease easter-like [Drosophila novamexicana]|uniref:serine protease easter-like n=1 Tax=Drosophila novamexicana TaxID=47314 RepID=UPI0011E5A394|nr:serine protease easter-like [Drosophila novamexicana]